MAASTPGTRSVTGGLAAVDVQDLAGDVRRCLQEQDAVDDVADLADAPERGKPVTESVIAVRRVHRRLDDARRDGVDPDAARGVLDPAWVAKVAVSRSPSSARWASSSASRS